MATEFHLIIEPASGDRIERRVPYGSYVLGRDEEECDITIPSDEVSRRHARLSFSASRCTVEDLGSTSGTVHTGQTVSEK